MYLKLYVSLVNVLSLQVWNIWIVLPPKFEYFWCFKSLAKCDIMSKVIKHIRCYNLKTYLTIICDYSSQLESSFSSNQFQLIDKKRTVHYCTVFFFSANGKILWQNHLRIETWRNLVNFKLFTFILYVLLTNIDHLIDLFCKEQWLFGTLRNLFSDHGRLKSLLCPSSQVRKT